MTSIAELNVVGECVLRLLSTADAAVALVRSASVHEYHAVALIVGGEKKPVPVSLLAYDDCPGEVFTTWSVRLVHHGSFRGFEVYNALVQLNEFGLRVGIEVFNLDPDSVQKGRLFRVVESSVKEVQIGFPTKLRHPMSFYGQRWQLVGNGR